MVEKNQQKNNVLWHVKIVWHSNVSVHISSFIGTQPRLLIDVVSMAAFPVIAKLNSYNTEAGATEPEYLLSGPLQKELTMRPLSFIVA